VQHLRPQNYKPQMLQSETTEEYKADMDTVFSAPYEAKLVFSDQSFCLVFQFKQDMIYLLP